MRVLSLSQPARQTPLSARPKVSLAFLHQHAFMPRLDMLAPWPAAAASSPRSITGYASNAIFRAASRATTVSSLLS